MSAPTLLPPTTGVPYLPETAPFTPAQRAWLNGLLAGFFSSAPGTGAPMGTAPALPPVKLKVSVLFGSESGNAEALAKRLAKAGQKRGWEATARGLDKLTAADLAREQHVLLITSTFGDGEPPENAKAFHAELHDETQARLEHLGYSVFALGDTNYEKFCACGQEFDARFAALGAKRLYERVDGDVDYEAAFERWQAGVFGVLEAKQADNIGAGQSIGKAHYTGGQPAQAIAVSPTAGLQPAIESPRSYSRQNPFPARLLVNRKLTTDSSAKETRHFEISLAGSDLHYEAGDALGVLPTNCPTLVDDLLHALNRDGEEAVPTPDGREASLRNALLRHYEISKIPASLLKAIAERSSDKTLAELLQPLAKEVLASYLHGREIIDLLQDFSSVSFSPAEFVTHLRRLQPRLYSISSSLKAFPDQVHLTVASVRYQSFGRPRKGVCSTFLADRASGPVPVFVHHSPAFRLPKESERAIIMVGPGTGVAPFRAFLHERRALGATGRNWLFFGEQRAASDFFYREEFESMSADGHLTHLTTAFSRDQAEKVYVQHRMCEQGAELWSWLQEGAHFYVCGDGSRMAKDVDLALHQVAQTEGGLSEEGAAEYIKQLKAEKRYQRDVY